MHCAVPCRAGTCWWANKVAIVLSSCSLSQGVQWHRGAASSKFGLAKVNDWLQRLKDAILICFFLASPTVPLVRLIRSKLLLLLFFAVSTWSHRPWIDNNSNSTSVRLGCLGEVELSSGWQCNLSYFRACFCIGTWPNTLYGLLIFVAVSLTSILLFFDDRPFCCTLMLFCLPPPGHTRSWPR